MRDRRQDMAANAVAFPFEREASREARNACLGSAVVALAKVAVQSAGRRRVDNDTARTTLLHVIEDRSSDAVGALEMDGDDGIPEIFRCLREALVAQDASVVDEDVHLAESIERRGENRFSALDIRHVVVVRNRFAPRRLDLVRDQLGHRRPRA